MIVVTGASKGLGRAICDRLISKNLSVFGLARNIEKTPIIEIIMIHGMLLMKFSFSEIGG